MYEQFRLHLDIITHVMLSVNNNINNHPVWKGVNPIKKQGHLVRLFLAKQYAKSIPREKLVGIIGSVGKTTTALASEAVLGQKYKTISTTQNSKLTSSLDPIFSIPITLLKVKKGVEKVILEMGIEYPGEMDFYLSIIKPKTAIVTRLSLEHSEFLGDLEQIINEEAKLIQSLPKDGLAILNYDDQLSRSLSEKTESQILFYGTDSQNCHVWADKIKIQDFVTSFELNYGVERVAVKSKLLGLHQVYPLLAAASLGISFDMPLITIKKGLELVEPAEHRLQALTGFNGSILLDDTYNAQPVAVEEALETLNHVPARRRIVVLGEMKELGAFSEKMHRNVAQQIFKQKIDLVFTGTGDTKYILDELNKLGFPDERIEGNLQNPQIVSKLLKVLVKGDVVLVKGAHSTKLNEVVEKLVRLQK